MKRYIVLLLIIGLIVAPLIWLNPSVGYAAAKQYPETPYPVCTTTYVGDGVFVEGEFAQIDVSTEITMTLFQGYWLRISQINPGLTQYGVSLPLFPNYRHTYGSAPIINNVGGTPITLYYCYDLIPNTSTPIPTPTTTTTSTATVACGAGNVIAIFDWNTPVWDLAVDGPFPGWYAWVRLNGMPIDIPLQYTEIRVALSFPALGTYYRQYATIREQLWAGGDGGAQNADPARDPWPQGQYASSLVLADAYYDQWIDRNFVVGGETVNRYYFDWFVNRTDYGDFLNGHPPEVPPTQRICITGLPVGTPTPTVTDIPTNTPHRPDPNLSPTVTDIPTNTPHHPDPNLSPTVIPSLCPVGDVPLYPDIVAIADPMQFVSDTGYVRVVVVSGQVQVNGSYYWSGSYYPAYGSSPLYVEPATWAYAWICKAPPPPTSTPTATATSTTTPTAPTLPCPVADRIAVPVAPGSVDLRLTMSMRFVVVDATIWVNVGSSPYEIRPGNYSWDLTSGTYTAYSLTTPAQVWVCVGAATSTPTTTGTTWATPGGGGVATVACVPLSPTATSITYAMPGLGIVIPQRATRTPTITSTMQISITALVAFQQTMSAGISTPGASMATISAGFSWQAGQTTGATSIAMAGPALGWFAVLNPQNPAWSSEGGPLWAIQPAIWPVLPVIIGVILAALARFGLWVVDWMIKLVKLVIAVIKLLPFL